MSRYTTEQIKESFIHGDTVDGDGVEWECLREDAEATFEIWHAAEIRRAKEAGWDEAAEIDAGCHDCIELNGETNPYREAAP